MDQLAKEVLSVWESVRELTEMQEESNPDLKGKAYTAWIELSQILNIRWFICSCRDFFLMLFNEVIWNVRVMTIIVQQTSLRREWLRSCSGTGSNLSALEWSWGTQWVSRDWGLHCKSCMSWCCPICLPFWGTHDRWSWGHSRRYQVVRSRRTWLGD